MPRPILIFDFDGTVALGDGPVRAYARAVAEQAGLGPSFVDDVAAGLAATEGADAGSAEATDDAAIDAYDLVRVLAVAAGATPDALSRGYAASRTQLASEAAPITAPDGLAAFLADVDAERILVTNAPGVRIPEALSALGLDRHFDRIVVSAGKPDGLADMLDGLGDDAAVLAVGDIWRNDLAPAHERGHATALVGGYPDPSASPDFHARTLPELLPALSDWVRAHAYAR
ncbi:HAD family hydrolase [Microbacterium sp. VKM Ac-2870]|uniref:HAD family hydrolase n=1 Tax=Microbacterium sp. VKM Ac-2870 TaxID=2783825 RepID=UPI00188BAEAD|nr:HAD family hydrolase [Microbacterium sp. VKM Ac-2870]MBF4563094.1 HAD family hydrolase [Microbacterium sp. VKM Ac-2870]